MSNRGRHRKKKNYKFFVKMWDDIANTYIKYCIENNKLKTCQIEEDIKRNQLNTQIPG